MPRTEEVIRAGDGEAHRVLMAFADTIRTLRIRPQTEEPGVRRDEERTIRRIDAQGMHVHGTRIDRCARFDTVEHPCDAEGRSDDDQQPCR